MMIRGSMHLESSQLSPQRHRVVAKDVDDFDGDDVAAGLVVGVSCGVQFEVADLAGAEALPFVLEDVGAGPAFLEVVGG